MDQMVLEVQEWLNTTYGGNVNYTKVTEDGITGGTTVAALITALQIEIGISSPDGVFGPATLSACPTLSSTSGTKNEICILQGALYCKGYNPNGIDGVYGSGVMTAIKTFQSNAGLTTQDGITTPMIFKAILNTDAYTLISGGDSNIRIIQQNLNRDYNSIIGLIPSNGIYSKSTNVALIKALQHEEGNSVDGIWGTNTKNLCPTIPGSKATKNFILLLQYALYCNGYNPNGFDGLYGNGVKTAVTNFQTFIGLTADGYAGPQVWASLLVSYGDQSRTCTACDCSTTITSEIAQTLRSNGYQVVGRYLTGKYAMSASELQTIFANGLKVFPIFEYRNDPLNFLLQNGAADADMASMAASSYGFYDNTVIYFAVDYDALDSDVTDSIIPYFQGINNAFASNNIKYTIGIYGPRNVCSRVIAEGLAVYAFVSDMSSGFSGNIGYKLPSVWSFDQINTVTIGSGDGQISIDKDVSSGRDLGVSSVNSAIMGDIINVANTTGLASLLGIAFDAVGDPITLIDTPNLKVELEFSLGNNIGNDSNTIKFKNGEFEDATVQTVFKNISTGLDANGAVELTEILSKINSDTEISMETSYNGGDSITISIETETTQEIKTSSSVVVTSSQQVTFTQNLNIELTFNPSDTSDSLVSDVQNSVELAFNYVSSTLSDDAKKMLKALMSIGSFVSMYSLDFEQYFEDVIKSILTGLKDVAIAIIIFLAFVVESLATA
jgi:peptidoglycan hydrolase-like protein with peptidoglycan-binding domain